MTATLSEVVQGPGPRQKEFQSGFLLVAGEQIAKGIDVCLGSQEVYGDQAARVCKRVLELMSPRNTAKNAENLGFRERDNTLVFKTYPVMGPP